eukprot:TRINITY_DN966_c3_g1_i1.p1 TRINITY_DN966_c3_g1~~TRINITY_DN966_c3_g1_i1.p1  ORF type:complete len:1532 (-),score=349.65 TRINITY_DN966_c3_g1_i1:31-4626(-)
MAVEVATSCAADPWASWTGGSSSSSARPLRSRSRFDDDAGGRRYGGPSQHRRHDGRFGNRRYYDDDGGRGGYRGGGYHRGGDDGGRDPRAAPSGEHGARSRARPAASDEGIAVPVRLAPQWALPGSEEDGGGESSPSTLLTVVTDSAGGALQGSVCARAVVSGALPVGALPSGPAVRRPATRVLATVLGAPERPDRDDLPKYDRVVLLEVSPAGQLHASQVDGIVARLQLGGAAWIHGPLISLPLDAWVLRQASGQEALPEASTEEKQESLEENADDGSAPAAGASLASDVAEKDLEGAREFYRGSVGCRRAGGLVFCEGLMGMELGLAEQTLGVLPPEYRPHGGRRCYLAVSPQGERVHFLAVRVDAAGRLVVRRSHAQGRARDGHLFEATVSRKHPGRLELNLGCVRFAARQAVPLELLADARAPRQFAARKRLAYLGLTASEEAAEGGGSPDELDGFQVASCTRQGSLVLVDGAVLLTTRHRYTAFARLPRDCWPSQAVTLLVARSLPQDRLVPERLDVTTDGELLCPQLPDEMGVEHIIHLNGAAFGVAKTVIADVEDVAEDDEARADGAGEAEEEEEEVSARYGVYGSASPHSGVAADADYSGVGGGSIRRGESEEEKAWWRLKELEQRDRRFRGKFRSGAELLEFERLLQWFRSHDCTESHRLTHSCFKGRSDFTQTGMLVFDTEEDLEGLNKAIAWLYERRVPVVLMERQTRVFPMIFDIDLKCTDPAICAKVPERIKNAKPWRGPVDFCLWHGADFLVLTGDLLLLRHLSKIIFQFFPDLPLFDLLIFNASGWDRVKEYMKVSIHIVAPYVLVTPERLTAIRERMLEYLGETSEHKGHPLQLLLERYLSESSDNTWDKVVDQTVTSGTNGLRMPFCDKAQRVLKREFLERKRQGEIIPERELQDKHAYVREEVGRPCLPEGILRFTLPPKDADEAALPDARWMCSGRDLPIEEWIRLGRCRYTWRLPLAPPGPTPWRPPLRYQWAEPAKLWEDRADLKGSPVVRRFSGSGAEFRRCWDEAIRQLGSKLRGGWLASGSGARWRGGLLEDSSHEVRYVERAGRAVLLLAPEPGSARTFAELRAVLAGWTEPDDEGTVPLCGAITDTHSAALHTVIAPSEEFPDIRAALAAIPVDEPLHRVLVRAGVHEFTEPLVLRTPVLLEGEGRWETIFRTKGCPVLRFEGAGAQNAMVRNLRLEMTVDEKEDHPEENLERGTDWLPDANTEPIGAAAVEMAFEGVSGGEPALVGCQISAAGRWGVGVRAWGSAPQVVRNHVSTARWGAVFADADGRLEDNEFLGLGESGIVLVGGAPWVHRNKVGDCGAAGILVAAECHAVLEANEVKDCLVGVLVVGKLADIEMRVSDVSANRLVHNGISDEHQLESPPGVIPRGATATVRSCRPYPFLPKTSEELCNRLRLCADYAEQAVLVRAARRHGLFREAHVGHRRLALLWHGKKPKGARRTAPPAPCEVRVASKAWDGRAAGYGASCVTVRRGTLCEIWQVDESGWLLVVTSDGGRGWCSPHALN